MLSGTDLQYAYSMETLVSQSAQQQQPHSGSRSTMLQKSQVPVSLYSQKVKEAFDEQQLSSGGVYETGQNGPSMQLQGQQQVIRQQNAQPVVVLQQQPSQQVQAIQTTQTTAPTYLDQLVSKRRDMLKVIIFAVSILLAISLHTVVEFWLKEISVSKELAFKQELGLRALYPILIVLTLWLLKSFQGGGR